MWVCVCGGRCSFFSIHLSLSVLFPSRLFLIYHTQRHIELSFSPCLYSSCSQAKSSAHKTRADRWKEDAEEEREQEEINRPKEENASQSSFSVVVTRCTAHHHQPRQSTTTIDGAIAWEISNIHERNESDGFEDERKRVEGDISN